MPFPKTWTEEPILEWLQLKEYSALSNVRLKSGKRGGVEEADIIGLRLRQKPVPQSKTVVEVLEALHVEVQCLALCGFRDPDVLPARPSKRPPVAGLTDVKRVHQLLDFHCRATVMALGLSYGSATAHTNFHNEPAGSKSFLTSPLDR